MTDNPNDPWRSLADELGVQPGKEPPAPASDTTPPTPPPQRRQPQATPHREPPKKTKADWNALAGELGLEAIPEEETTSTAQDHVAELLGFPPPGAFPPAEEREAGRRRAEGENAYGAEDDTEQSDRPIARQQWQDEGDERGSKSFDDTRPVYYDEPTEGGGNRDRPQGGDERGYRPSRGRRGRGGRGRGNREGGDRGGYRGGSSRSGGSGSSDSGGGGSRSSGSGGSNSGSGNSGGSGSRSGDSGTSNSGGSSGRGGERQGNRSGGQYRDRPPYEEGHYAKQEPQGDQPFDADTTEGAAPAAGEFGSENRPRPQDEQSQPRRRRRRRGRGGRDRDRDVRPGRESQAAGERAPEHDHDEIPYLELVSDDELADHHDVAPVDFSAADELHELESASRGERSGSSIPAAHADDHDEHDEAELSDGDENSSGKTAVRDIVTWKEAIGMIIDGNMQSRAHTPQHNSHNSRGPRGGHGRGGRGRGGRRR